MVHSHSHNVCTNCTAVLKPLTEISCCIPIYGNVQSDTYQTTGLCKSENRNALVENTKSATVKETYPVDLNMHQLIRDVHVKM
jgi:hypothetical protein